MVITNSLTLTRSAPARQGFHLTVAQYGPFGIGAIPGARVSEPIEGDVLKSGGRDWLLEGVAHPSSALSYSPGDSLGHRPLQVPVHLGVRADDRSGALQSPVSLSA